MKIILIFNIKTRRKKKLWKRLRTVSKQSKHIIYTKTALKVWLTDLGRVGRRTVDQSSALKEGGKILLGFVLTLSIADLKSVYDPVKNQSLAVPLLVA